MYRFVNAAYYKPVESHLLVHSIGALIQRQQNYWAILVHGQVQQLSYLPPCIADEQLTFREDRYHCQLIAYQHSSYSSDYWHTSILTTQMTREEPCHKFKNHYTAVYQTCKSSKLLRNVVLPYWSLTFQHMPCVISLISIWRTWQSCFSDICSVHVYLHW